MTSGAVIPGGRAVPSLPLPLLLALPVLAVSAVLPWQAGWVCAVAVIVVLGVPHGALDVEIGRNLLRGRIGGWWFPVFAGPYLLLVGSVLLAWRSAPEATLAAFLAASVWHFGTEDTGGGGWPALFRGGLPVAVPVLLHPEATAGVFSAASGLAFRHPPAWLTAASILWLVSAFPIILRSRPRDLVLPGMLCAAFAALPPITAFALYFVAVHAPAHTAALIRHPSRAPRVRDEAAAWRLAAPTTVLTVAIGAALWPAYTGEAPVRLLCLALQLLAAFTLPHMILDAWLDHRDRPTGQGRNGAFPTAGHVPRAAPHHHAGVPSTALPPRQTFLAEEPVASNDDGDAPARSRHVEALSQAWSVLVALGAKAATAGIIALAAIEAAWLGLRVFVGWPAVPDGGKVTGGTTSGRAGPQPRGRLKP